MTTDKTVKGPINEWYVLWANSLDSAGEDSSAVRDRLHEDAVAQLEDVLYRCVLEAQRADAIKKYLFYGKDTDFEGFVVNWDSQKAGRAKLENHETIRLLHGILGKIDEAGELAKALHSFLFYGKDLDRDNIREEVGDSRWYDALIAKYLGDTDFDAIDWANYRKLTARYPEKRWTQGHALNRDLDKEKEALSGTESGTQDRDNAQPE